MTYSKASRWVLPFTNGVTFGILNFSGVCVCVFSLFSIAVCAIKIVKNLYLFWPLFTGI